MDSRLRGNDDAYFSLYLVISPPFIENYQRPLHKFSFSFHLNDLSPTCPYFWGTPGMFFINFMSSYVCKSRYLAEMTGKAGILQCRCMVPVPNRSGVWQYALNLGILGTMPEHDNRKEK